MFGPKQVLDWLRAVCAASNKYSIGSAQCARPQTSTRLASRSVRGPKQALDWLRAHCAARNKRSIGAAAAASEVWPGTKPIPPHSCTKHTSPASAEAGRQRNLVCYETKSHLIMYQAYFPGLGGGLRGLKQALDRLRTVAQISSVIRAPTKGFSRR